MAKKTIDEAEDNSTGAIMHQGKSIAQWEQLLKKDFNFTQDQILRLIRSGVDLGRMLQGLDEGEADFNNPVFKDEEFFFEKDKEEKKDEAKKTNESLVNLDSEDVVTIEDLLSSIRARTQLNDKVMFRIDKQEYSLFDLHSKGGIAVFDFVKGRLHEFEDNSIDLNEEQKYNPNKYAHWEIEVIDPNNKKHILRTYMKGTEDEVLEYFHDMAYNTFNRTEKFKLLSDTLRIIPGTQHNNKLYEETEDKNATNESDDDFMTVSDLVNELQDSTSVPTLDVVIANVEDNPYYVTKVIPKKRAVLLRCIPAGTMNENVELDSNETLDDFMTVSDLRDLGQKAYPHSTSAWLVDNIAGIVDGKVIDFKSVKYVRPEGYPSNGTFFLLDDANSSIEAYQKAKELMLSEKETTNESITPAQWQEAAAWFNANGYPIEDDEARLEQVALQLDQFLFKVGMSPTHDDKAISGDEGWRIYMSMKNNVNEGRGWYGGGYGGTGKTWKGLGNDGPRGAQIGWYAVEQLDPKAKGKMPGWRCGPSNFPFTDLLYPERKYVKGAMVMRNKYIKAGSMSGEKYIALASYFDALKNNDLEAIGLLNALGIPLDLTFGMNPNDDYSNNYTIKK